MATEISPPAASQKGDESLSTAALEVGELTGIMPLYRQLCSEQKLARSGNDKSALDRLIRAQRISYLHIRINQYMQTANLEVSSVNGKLNSGMAELADRQAAISDARARMLRRSSVVNMFSGGMTKIGGYSSALTPASLIPTNVLEVFDGGVQMGLSAFTIRQQRAESKLNQDKPLILMTFLTGNNQTTKEFPETVWTYLGRPDSAPGGSKTRRQTLIDRWVKAGRLTSGANEKVSAKRTKQIAGIKTPTNDLDDTVAMMSDVKSIVASMGNAFLEISTFMKDSYKDDPVF